MFSLSNLVFLFFLIASICCTTKIHVTLYYPDNNLSGSQLYIRGNGSNINWDQGTLMKQTEANKWEIDLEISDLSNEVEFKALVDDTTWQIGANFGLTVDSTKKTHSFVGYPWFYTTNGKYVYLRKVYSPQLKNTRDVVTYLPPSYYENKFKRYDQVIIACDGQNLFNKSTSFLVPWYIQNTVDELISEGKMEEVVVVGIDNAGEQRTVEYTYDYDPTVKDGGKADVYLDFVEDVVLPLVNSNYRLSAKKYTTLGSSLGGILSCYAGWTRPSVYDKSVCMSSSFWWNSESFNTNILVNKPAPEPLGSFYLDSGDQGDGKDDEEETIRVREHMKKLGYTMDQNLFYYLDKGAYHNEYYWGKRFWIPMTYLFAPSPDLV
ncbi:putative conserved membrane protein [Anaeramoeba flamelloides]|uniref:Conserved membrane protein n=1 Tax=Anaeramoeba flamelloides TaxID=1746091 RepID=A0AAV7Z017_9EUKA|nr:putative conserved membrane protein [Anaeramoeba flamelloides]